MKASSLKQVSHSELRHRILSSLNLEPANSVTSLAQRLEILRPSVSRAVSSLYETGLITRQGRIISLSEAGQEELNNLNTELSLKVKKSTNLATRLLEHATETSEIVGNSSFSQLADALMNNSLSQLADTLMNNSFSQLADTLMNNSFSQLADTLANNSFSQLADTLANNSFSQLADALANNSFSQLNEGFAKSNLVHFSEIITNSPVLQAAKEITNYAPLQLGKAFEVITATASIQTINLGLLQNWKEEVFSPLSHLVLENNVFLSNMMVDLEALTSVGTIVSQSLDILINQTVWTTKVYDTYFLDVISDFKQPPTFDSLQLSLAIPTTGAASLVGSTRRMVELETLLQPEKEPIDLFVARMHTSSEKYVTLTPKLETYLKPLGQRFVDKWEGAWQTLYSQGKDRHSQATHSGRELLMQVLAYLAPDAVFTKEDCRRHGVNKPSRKMRIKHILGYDHRSTIDLIDCMANTMDGMYDVLVREAHRRDDNNHLDDTIIGQLAALGALLIMLLSMRSDIQS